MIIDPGFYLKPVSEGGLGDTSGDIRGPWVRTRGEDISFTFVIPASTSRAGILNFYGTDDPRALVDNERVIKAVDDGVAYTPVADEVQLTIPDEAVHIDPDAGAGFVFSGPGTDITVAAVAGKMLVILENPPSYVRAFYDSTTDGSDDDLTAYRSGR